MDRQLTRRAILLAAASAVAAGRARAQMVPFIWDSGAGSAPTVTTWSNETQVTLATIGGGRGADIVLSNGNLTATGDTLTVGFAVDLDNDRFWARSGGGGWSAAGDPGANANGKVITTIAAGTVFPAFGVFNGSVATINGGATQFQRELPSGFSAWDAAVTWDSANKGTNITLSNGDLTATGTAASSWESVRGTVGHTTGKWYFELTVDFVDANDGWMGGIENGSGTLTSFPGNTVNGASVQSVRHYYTNNVDEGVWLSDVPNFTPHPGMFRMARSEGTMHASGKWYAEITADVVDSGDGWMGGIASNTTVLLDQNVATYLQDFSGGNNFSVGFQTGADRNFWINGAGTTNVLAGALTQGDVLCLAIDLDNDKIWGRVNGGAWSDAGDPATNTNGRGIGATNSDASGVSLTFSTFDVAAGSFDSATLNPGPTFAFTPPAGFSAWDVP